MMLWKRLNQRALRIVGFLLCGFLVSQTALGVDENQLPRVAPLSPAQALTTFHLAKGFRIEQVAVEPLVVDPVAMAFDEQGRLYVVEMRDYSEQDKERLGRVRLLTDKDGDGKFDTSTIVSESLSWPTAVACYDGGVFIGAAPDLYYCKDNDGDGIADQQDLICSGFDRMNVQRLPNSFHWGLDNLIYGAASIANSELTWPDAANKKLELRSRDFAFDPRTGKFTALTGGGQHGMSFNRWGDRFVCSNSDHLQAIVFEERYITRNPFQSTPAPRRSIAADGPQAEVYRSSPVEAWRIARTKMRLEGRASGPVEGGGRASGYFTSATGVTIYEGDLWPDEFRGYAFVADVGSNLVHRKRLVRSGVTYRGERVDRDSEFLTSTDVWFRPVQMAIGPEGALYIADMYREVIEHPNSLPPELKSQIDLTSGRDRGRIYRIVPIDRKPPQITPLHNLTTAELVAALDHANLWRRTTAARLLNERQDPQAIEPLRDLMRQSARPETRIAAMYALDGLSALTADDLLNCLDDEHPQVRRHAIRLTEPRLAGSAPLRQRLLNMVSDQDLVVRFQLALSLGVMQTSGRVKALADLLVHNGNNADVAGAALSSMVDCAGPVLSELLDNKNWAKSAEAEPIVSAIVRQIERQQRDEDLTILLKLVASADEAELGDVTSRVLIALGRSVSEPTNPKLAELRQAQVKAGQSLIHAAELALDSDSTSVEERVAAVRALQLDSFSNQSERLARQLTPGQPTMVQAAVLDVLAHEDSPAVASVIIDAWQQFTPGLHRRAVEVISQRESWLVELLQAVKAAELHRADIEPNHWATWSRHPSPAVRKLVAELHENSVAIDRRAVFRRYRSVLEANGDSKRGKEVFSKNCASCHRLDEEGHELGPNLAAMLNRGEETMLYNILVPNAEVDARYVNYVVTTVNGRVLTGVIESETATSVTLRAASDETHEILRVDIEDMQSTGMSLMPEGLEQAIDETAMADLLAYLNLATRTTKEDKP